MAFPAKHGAKRNTYSYEPREDVEEDKLTVEYMTKGFPTHDLVKNVSAFISLELLHSIIGNLALITTFS